MSFEGIRLKDISSPESLAIIKKEVEALLSQNLWNPQNPYNGDNALIAWKNHVLLVSRELAGAKGASVTAINTALMAMNGKKPGEGVFYDPLTPFGAPPGMVGRLTNATDNPAGQMQGRPKDPLKEIDQTYRYSDGQSRKQKMESLNLFNEAETTENNEYIDISDPQALGKQGMKIIEPIPGVKYDVPDYSKVFEAKSTGPDFGSGRKGYIAYEPKQSTRHRPSQLEERKKRALANDDVFFHKKDVTHGYVEDSDVAEMAGMFSDNDLYVPFYFQDLRKPDRKIYFRAFIKSIKETITPKWNEEDFYGRVDPVGIYKGTSRTFDISFIVAAMSPAGFTSMWKKINNVTKLLYPQQINGVLARAPVGRVRVGDLFADGEGNGLAGYIKSWNMDYTEFPWEITSYSDGINDMEMGIAPMAANISFSYQVIHDLNPVIDENYNFNSANFRGIGRLTDFVSNNKEDITEETGTDGGEST